MLKIILLLHFLITSAPSYSYNMLFFYKITPENPPIFHTDFQFHHQQLCSPVIKDHKVYQGMQDGLILSQDIETKRILWEYHVIGQPTGVAYNNNIIIFTTLKGNIYALNMDKGGLLWSYDTHKEILAKPVIQNDNLYIQTSLDTLYAFNVNDGTLNWQYTSKNVLEGLVVHMTPAPYISKNVLYTGFSNGDAVAFDTRTGSILWTHKPATVKQFQDITVQPVGNNSIVIFSSYDNGLMCLNKKDGTMVWERNDLKRTVAMFLTKNAVYAGLVDGNMYRLDIRTGDTIWKQSIGSDSTIYIPGEFQTLLVLGIGENTNKGIILMNEENGQIMKHFSIVSGLSSSPLIEDNKIYATSNGGFLYSFQ